VRYVGCSNETAYGLTKALYVAQAHELPRYQTIQNNFSLLNRRFEDELANVCRREAFERLSGAEKFGMVCRWERHASDAAWWMHTHSPAFGPWSSAAP
jgi:hypothetical protein